MKIGSLEAGGTKMMCAIGSEKGELFEEVSFPTESPEITMPKIIDFFRNKEIEALGVACFGPIDLHRSSPTYGYITSTPKIAWRQFDIVGTLSKALHVPVGFDTDVHGSLLGEATWGAAKGKENALYITIGTGVGLGVMANGKLLHGLLHPEGGHIPLRTHKEDAYKGNCPYHGNCFEGMAAGPAIEARWGAKGVELSSKREVWELEAYYIAQALYNYILVLSPECIILGGGVMKQSVLFPLIHKEVLRLNAGYLSIPPLQDEAAIASYIVPAALNDKQGILGGICLGMAAWQEENAAIGR